MAYIDTVVEVLRHAPGPLTTHEIAEAVSKSVPSDRQPSEAAITTWLYAIGGSHDHPGVHRVDRSGARGPVCWVCDAEQARGVDDPLDDKRSPTAGWRREDHGPGLGAGGRILVKMASPPGPRAE